MSNGSCSNLQCTAASTGVCFENKGSVDVCNYWGKILNPVDEQSTIKEMLFEGKQKIIKKNRDLIEWSGSPFQLNEIELVSRRGNPFMISTVGEVFAGKSSFLGMLHTLLIRGQMLNRYSFAGSLTLFGWEELARSLRFNKGEAKDQTPTPSDPGYYSLLHWALRREDGRLIDIVFPDASGEVFSQWAVNRADSNADNVRWIHRNADAFLFFINCEALAQKRGAAVTPLIDLANRLVEDINGRPIIIVWAKADTLEQVRPSIKENIVGRLQQVFGDVPQFNISKILTSEPDQAQQANLYVIDAALQQIEACRPYDSFQTVATATTNDHFLLYRGK